MTTTGRLAAGLVGAGHISEFHVAALRRQPQVDLVGVFDLDPSRAEALAAKLGLRTFPSLSALRDAGATVIHVLTPPHTHARVAAEALRAGCHVFVEKPLATDPEDCAMLADLARSLGREVGVCHSLLYDPQIRKALEAVRRGEIGDVVSVDILRSSLYPPHPGGKPPPQYSTAGYPFRDLGIHCLYLMEAFLGPIENVTASWQSLGGDPNLAFDEWRALVRCKRGQGQFQLSWNVRPLQNQIILQGKKGVLRVDLFLMFQAPRKALPLPKAAERIVNALTDSLRPLIDVPTNVAGFATGRIRQYHGLQDLVGAFYDALAAGRRPPVTIADAVSPVRWTEEIARAADREHEARTKRPRPESRPDFVVTGASGGLGSAVVERLRAEGARVRVLVRRPPENLAPEIEVVQGDLGDPDAVDRALAGARYVIHAGAAMKGPWIEHERGTIDGTRNVIASARKHGVERLVHVGSMSVIDWSGGAPFSPVSEETPLEPRADERGFYTRAKLEAERLAVAAAGEGLPVVIVRPGQIFGRRIPLMTAAVARRLGPFWLALGDGQVPLPLVYIDDVVDALTLAARSDLRRGEIVQLVDPHMMTQVEVLHAVHGPTAPLIKIPRAAVFFAGKVSEQVLGLAGRKSPLSEYRLRSALALRAFESQRAERLLCWRPRVGVRAGIELVRRQMAGEA